MADCDDELELIGCVMRCENHAFPFFVARPTTLLVLLIFAAR